MPPFLAVVSLESFAVFVSTLLLFDFSAPLFVSTPEFKAEYSSSLLDAFSWIFSLINFFFFSFF